MELQYYIIIKIGVLTRFKCFMLFLIAEKQVIKIMDKLQNEKIVNFLVDYKIQIININNVLIFHIF